MREEEASQAKKNEGAELAVSVDVPDHANSDLIAYVTWLQTTIQNFRTSNHISPDLGVCITRNPARDGSMILKAVASAEDALDPMVAKSKAADTSRAELEEEK